MRASLHAILALSAAVCCAGEQTLQEALGLRSTQFHGLTVHYEDALGAELPAFQAACEEFLAKDAQGAKLRASLIGRAKEIGAEASRMVGVRDPQVLPEQQERLLTLFLGQSFPFSQKPQAVTLCLVRRDTVKDCLRKGGLLKDFAYDKATDQATYNFSIGGAGRQEAISVAVLAASADAVPEAARTTLSALTAFGESLTGVALYQVAGATLLHRLHPADAQHRWFLEGFANAIAARLLRKFVSEEAARSFDRRADLARHSEFEKELNLLCWMAEDYCIDTPLASEGRLNEARAAYATVEAERLIQEHGIETIARVLDKVSARPTTRSQDLSAAFFDVTGESVAARFQRYQSFQGTDEGIKRYADALDAAMEKKDYAAALFMLLRVQEVKGTYDIRLYADAAGLLALMGREAAGDRVFQKQLALLSQRGAEEPYAALQALFVSYAMRCSNLERAYEAAEDVLKKAPDFVPALAARMERLARSGKLEEAKALARRIQTLEKNPQADASRFAQKVLEAKMEK